MDMSGKVLLDSYRPNVGQSESSSQCYRAVTHTRFPSVSGITFQNTFLA